MQIADHQRALTIFSWHWLWSLESRIISAILLESK